MEKAINEIDKSVIYSIMSRAIQINTSCKEMCRDFKIMESSKHKNTLILRWRTIDISNVDNPVQSYRYECFKLDGTPQYCSIYYSNVEQANEFIESLTSLHHQQFAIDHTL